MGLQQKKKRQPENIKSNKENGQEGNVVKKNNNKEERKGKAKENKDLSEMEKYTLKAVEKWDTNQIQKAIQQVLLQ